ncbi:MAG: hypothetical protein ACLP5H_34165 [Desulfomonilaceae bacterium]
MGFLMENMILTGQGDCLEFDMEQWCALLNLGMMPEPDEHGRPLPGEVWKQRYMSAMLDDERLPVTLSVEQARVFAESLEFYSAGIPEREDVGRVITAIDREIDGKWTKYAVTTGRGWIETDDVELLFLQDGKDIIRKAIVLLRSGTVRVELASRLNEMGR